MDQIRKLFTSVVFCACFFILSAVYAQSGTSKIDLLLKQARECYLANPDVGIKTANQALQIAVNNRYPSKQVKALELLAFFYYNNKNYQQGYLYADSAVAVGKRAKLDSLTGDALVTLGSIYSGEHRFDIALTKFQQALEYYRGPGTESRIATLFLNMGVCERKLGRFERAGKYYISAAESYQRLHDEPSLADAYNAIGNCFTSAGNYKGGIAYHRMALKLREKLRDNSAVAQSCSNLGYVLRLSGQADTAIYYLSRALAIRGHDPDSSHLVLTLQNLGAAWKIKGDLRSARKYIERSLRIAGAYHMSEELARGGLDMAEVLLAEGRTVAALIYVDSCIKTATRLGIPELMMTAYEIRIKLATQEHDYRTAYIFYRNRDRIKDSLLNATKARIINELEISYQTKQRKKDIEALTVKNDLERQTNAKQRQFLIVMAIAGCLLFVLLIILWVVYRQKIKASAHIQTLHQELHHRVKNNLQILSGLFAMQIESLNDETAKAALRENESRLTSMNLIHHKLYQDRSTTSIEMQDYLTKLALNLKDSFGSADTANITLKLDIEPIVLEADKAVAIGLISNELLTNVFKYSRKSANLNVVFSLKYQGDREAVLRLNDDGAPWEIPVAGLQLSFGLKIVNLMARQLDTKLDQERPGYTSYRLVVRV